MPLGAEFHDKYYEFSATFDIGRGSESLPGNAAEPGAGWTNTAISGGTGTSAITNSDDIIPPRWIITTADDDLDGLQCQWSGAAGSGEIFTPRAGKKLFFSCEFSTDEVTNTAVYLGLAVTDTTVIVGNTDFIGFNKADASLNVDFVSSAAGTTLRLGNVTVADTLTVVDDEGILESDLNSYSFILDGLTNAYVYANGVHVATANITGESPDQNMCPTIAFKSGIDGVHLLHISKFYVCAER
jgi:hypothetical protein